MATVLSSETSTTIVISNDEAAALEIILSDWRNTASQAIQDGYDPHGYTQQTWNQIIELAEAFGVETELDIDDATLEGSE